MEAKTEDLVLPVEVSLLQGALTHEVATQGVGMDQVHDIVHVGGGNNQQVFLLAFLYCMLI